MKKWTLFDRKSNSSGNIFMLFDIAKWDSFHSQKRKLTFSSAKQGKASSLKGWEKLSPWLGKLLFHGIKKQNGEKIHKSKEKYTNYLSWFWLFTMIWLFLLILHLNPILGEIDLICLFYFLYMKRKKYLPFR